MSAGLPSDEVAEDYRNSLEDLVINSRYEISNLTVIAKENTEHAMAISRVLENHIRSTPPDRKLPAMYVLDSIVKNIGTPYTLFLGRNLYHTFMNTYTLVNNQIRRKLDEMLRTWKEPVPGSLDTKPVFPPDVTRPIENALIKARTAAVQQQHQQQQQQQQFQVRHAPTPQNGWRNTPTPPQINGPYRPPQISHAGPQHSPQPGYAGQYFQNGHQQTNVHYQQGPPQYQAPPPGAGPLPSPLHQQYPSQPLREQAYLPQRLGNGNDIQALHREIEQLIGKARSDFATNIHDTSIQTRLKALLDLQGLMQQQQLSPHEIQMIRDQLNALSRPVMPPQNTASSSYISAPAPPPSYGQPTPTPQPFLQQQPSGSAPPLGDLQSLLSSNNLAAILAKAQRATPTPPQSYASLAVPSTMASNAAAPIMAPAPASDLMASLRAAGLVPHGASTPVNGGFPMTTPPPTAAIASLAGPFANLDLTSASLKVPHPELISQLYEARPNQCTTCARRFPATEDGREKKARHLDWHFRTNQRMADNATRGQSRSWFVDELDWIKSRDEPEVLTQASDSSAPNDTLGQGKAVVDPKTKYVPVPADQALANLPCPICQEKFDTVWNEEAQDFVWMDAVKIGGRIYHASCHSDVKRDGRSTPLPGARTSTPDSVLGKRKAED